MRKSILFTSLLISLLLAIGQAGYGNYISAAILAIWPAFVLISNLFISVRKYGW